MNHRSIHYIARDNASAYIIYALLVRRVYVSHVVVRLLAGTSAFVSKQSFHSQNICAVHKEAAPHSLTHRERIICERA